MLLNFKRNFTYLSCGAHSLRCSFERSFRRRQRDESEKTGAPESRPRDVDKRCLGHSTSYGRRLAQDAEDDQDASAADTRLIIHQNRSQRSGYEKFALICGGRVLSAVTSHSRHSLTHSSLALVRLISCGRLPFDLQFPFPFQWRFDWPCGIRSPPFLRQGLTIKR